MPSSVGEPPLDRFQTGKEGRGRHSWMEECDGGTFDLYSGLNRNPLSSGCVGEKGNQLHDKKLEKDGGSVA